MFPRNEKYPAVFPSIHPISQWVKPLQPKDASLLLYSNSKNKRFFIDLERQPHHSKNFLTTFVKFKMSWGTSTQYTHHFTNNSTTSSYILAFPRPSEMSWQTSIKPAIVCLLKLFCSGNAVFVLPTKTDNLYRFSDHQHRYLHSLNLIGPCSLNLLPRLHGRGLYCHIYCMA